MPRSKVRYIGNFVIVCVDCGKCKPKPRDPQQLTNCVCDDCYLASPEVSELLNALPEGLPVEPFTETGRRLSSPAMQAVPNTLTAAIERLLS